MTAVLPMVVPIVFRIVLRVQIVFRIVLRVLIVFQIVLMVVLRVSQAGSMLIAQTIYLPIWDSVQAYRLR